MIGSTSTSKRMPSVFLSTVFCIAIALAAPSVMTSAAYAGQVSLDSQKTTATIAPSKCLEYNSSSYSESMWNYGVFYVYFFQGATSVSYTSEKASGADVATRKYSVSFKDGVSWAKVCVAPVASSEKGNGDKYTRFRDDNAKYVKYGEFLSKSRKFYVWIDDSGGTLGTVSLSGTTKRTVYANGTTFSNVKTITVTSQYAADPTTQGTTESSITDVINIPFSWSGKIAHQVPYKEFCDKGVSSNAKYTFYRLNWRQYSSGTTYDGYSPYKLQHGVSSASNLWTSVNLGAIGITTVPTYKDSSYKKETGKVYRNTRTTLGICLKAPTEKVYLDTDGGTLTSGSSSYSSSAAEFASGQCASTATLPASGYRVGKDGTKTGYQLTGYSWKSGTNRGSFSTSSLDKSKTFEAFDQARPQAVSSSSPSITLCNAWTIPAFAKTNSSDDGDGKMLSAPSTASVTYKAVWSPKTYSIHYIVDGTETKTTQKKYDESYSLDSAPSGSTGWTVQKQDGTTASATGYMPSQDIYAMASSDETSTVNYYINGIKAATYEIPFGTVPLKNAPSLGLTFDGSGTWSVDSPSFYATYAVKGVSVIYRSSFDKPENSYGGELSAWYSNRTCTTEAEDSVTISADETVNFYAYTTHTIHFWMDAHVLGTIHKVTPENEAFCCVHEEKVRYGYGYDVPLPSESERYATRAGCASWSATCGTWYGDCQYEYEAEDDICSGDVYLFSYSTVEFDYDLAVSAKACDATEGGTYRLYSDKECTVSSNMRRFLPAKQLLRYGSTVFIGGDGQLFRKSEDGSAKTLQSVPGGYLSEDAEGDPVESLRLTQSTTIYKDWSQSLFDGVITG